MTHTARSGFVMVLVLAAVFSLILLCEAAQVATRPSTALQSPGGQVQSGPAVRLAVDDSDAPQTRERFYALLDKYPPTLGRVLKLDPSLLASDTYLAPYPAMAAFLVQHPEVGRNSSYFLERVNVASSYTIDQRTMQRREIFDMLGVLAAFVVFLVVTGVIIWLVRMIVEHRRWSRVSKTQFEVHSKLLDRFASNEELLAYIQTPAGRRFLESAPILMHDESRPMAAAFSRILWSAQVGIVLAITGAGLLFLSWRMIEEAAQFVFVIGTVTLALGVGFIVSGAAAYVLSRRLGLLGRPASDHA